jgi:hypothetical protein
MSAPFQATLTCTPISTPIFAPTPVFASPPVTPIVIQRPQSYKAHLCRTFEQHKICTYGEYCLFAHGKAEMELWKPYRNQYLHPLSSAKQKETRSFFTSFQAGVQAYLKQTKKVQATKKKPKSTPWSSSSSSSQELWTYSLTLNDKGWCPKDDEEEDENKEDMMETSSWTDTWSCILN